MKCPLFTAQCETWTHGSPPAAKLMARLQGSGAEGQGTAPQRCLIAVKRSQTTSLALKQQRSGARMCPSPWGLYLLLSICNSMHKTQKPLFLWAARGMQEPAWVRTAEWTQPAMHQGLFLWLLQLFATKLLGKWSRSSQYCELKLLFLGLAAALQAWALAGRASHAKAALWCALIFQMNNSQPRSRQSHYDIY